MTDSQKEIDSLCWWNRSPHLLTKAHLCINSLLSSILRFRTRSAFCNLDQVGIVAECKIKRKFMRKENSQSWELRQKKLEKERNDKMELITEIIVSLNNDYCETRKAFYPTQEQFGAAGTACEWCGESGESVHGVVVNVASALLRAILYPTPLSDPRSPLEVLKKEELMTHLDSDELLESCRSFFEQKNMGSPEWMQNHGQRRAHLRQEFFRAWQLWYPAGTKYEIYDSSKEDADDLLSNVLNDQELPMRPAYARDHLWYRWNIEGLTPAIIRDRWNSMSDKERKTISPMSWNKIGTNGKDKGRDLVKKSLARAASEYNNELC